MNRINSFFRIISLASFGVGVYGVVKSHKIESIYNQLESERLRNQILQKKYENLMWAGGGARGAFGSRSARLRPPFPPGEP
jgi:hypothetical protein